MSSPVRNMEKGRGQRPAGVGVTLTTPHRLLVAGIAGRAANPDGRGAGKVGARMLRFLEKDLKLAEARETFLDFQDDVQAHEDAYRSAMDDFAVAMQEYNSYRMAKAAKGPGAIPLLGVRTEKPERPPRPTPLYFPEDPTKYVLRKDLFDWVVKALNDAKEGLTGSPDEMYGALMAFGIEVEEDEPFETMTVKPPEDSEPAAEAEAATDEQELLLPPSAEAPSAAQGEEG